MLSRLCSGQGAAWRIQNGRAGTQPPSFFVKASVAPQGRGVVYAAGAAQQVQPSSRPLVVLTREAGKNDKMAAELAVRGLPCVELPLIEHQPGEDRPKLPGLLQDPSFDWVAVTSPEAAAVFLEAWEQAGRPQVRVAVVGAGTGDVLKAAGVTPTFTPTKALGKTMGSELPHLPGGTDRVLYPASAKASTDLQDSLVQAGFAVTRVHTYSTAGVKQVAPDLLARAKAAPIMTYGSPSAVKAWVALAGLETATAQASVCIGSTSARACEALGLQRVYYPDAPGIPGWVDAVERAASELSVPRTDGGSSSSMGGGHANALREGVVIS